MQLRVAPLSLPATAAAISGCRHGRTSKPTTTCLGVQLLIRGGIEAREAAHIQRRPSQEAVVSIKGITFPFVPQPDEILSTIECPRAEQRGERSAGIRGSRGIGSSGEGIEGRSGKVEGKVRFLLGLLVGKAEGRDGSIPKRLRSLAAAAPANTRLCLSLLFSSLPHLLAVLTTSSPR